VEFAYTEGKKVWLGTGYGQWNLSNHDRSLDRSEKKKAKQRKVVWLWSMAPRAGLEPATQ
jgi:hypothetical protein